MRGIMIVLLTGAFLGFGTGIVDAKCQKGFITCAAWCYKYRPEQKASGYQGCLRSTPHGCLAKWGSLNYCIRDQYEPYH